MIAPTLQTSTAARAAVLRHLDLRVLFRMNAVGKLFERRVEEFGREHAHDRKRHERPPDRRWPQPDQDRKGCGRGDRMRAEAAFGAQRVPNPSEGKT